MEILEAVMTRARLGEHFFKMLFRDVRNRPHESLAMGAWGLGEKTIYFYWPWGRLYISNSEMGYLQDHYGEKRLNSLSDKIRMEALSGDL